MAGRRAGREPELAGGEGCPGASQEEGAGMGGGGREAELSGVRGCRAGREEGEGRESELGGVEGRGAGQEGGGRSGREADLVGGGGATTGYSCSPRGCTPGRRSL